MISKKNFKLCQEEFKGHNALAVANAFHICSKSGQVLVRQIKGLFLLPEDKSQAGLNKSKVCSCKASLWNRPALLKQLC